MRKEFLQQLKEERKSYKEMIEFCCDSLILNNSIIAELVNYNLFFDIYSGNDREFLNSNGDYITENEYLKLIESGEDCEEIYSDIFQYFIISERDAERLAEYTNELVFYNELLDLYLLGVTHYGTSWDYVPANWKELEEMED